jgi:hypothetical protein
MARPGGPGQAAAGRVRVRAAGPTAARVRAAPEMPRLQECVVMVSPISIRTAPTLPAEALRPVTAEPGGRSFAGTVPPADPSQDRAWLRLLAPLLRAVGHSLKHDLPKFAQHGREVAAALQATAKATRPKPTPQQAQQATAEARKVFEAHLTANLRRKGLTDPVARSAAEQIANHFGKMSSVEKFIRSIPALVGWGTITAPVVDPAIDFTFDRMLDAVRALQPEPPKR